MPAPSAPHPSAPHPSATAGSGQTVLVTGGTGYVGGWCIVALLQHGYQVRTTVRSPARESAVRAAIATQVEAGDRLSFCVADLNSDPGWDQAVAGCDYVLHVASPLGGDRPKDAGTLIAPARDGALRVLRAATRAGVKRVVMTSSCAAASYPTGSREDGVIDETLWTDPDDRKLNAYRKSKTVSEIAAWRFMDSYQGSTELTTILPGGVFGPVLTAENPGSVQIVARLLQGRVAGNPRVGFGIVDVRDLAALHLSAMTSPQAAGERFIASGDFLWMREISQALRESLGSAAAKVPTKNLPDFVLKIAALFDPGVRAILPNLGRHYRHTSAKAARLLNWHPRPAKETMIDCAKSLIEKGMA
ncbi:MAG: aldehyde reductase [Akkermansiaceae bacterium]|nr:aldehyde reductase [Akkermansiaceae bacterium]